MTDTLPDYPSIGLKKPWAKTKCSVAFVILFLLYIIPIVFDYSPDRDSYWGGYSVLGVWGVLILTLLGIGLSIWYGYGCVSTHTVYACASGGLGCDDSGLVFPKGFPDGLKMIYVNQLKGKSKGLFNGWIPLPWSDYHSTLHKLNNKYLYSK
jgi:hypothetical protein